MFNEAATDVTSPKKQLFFSSPLHVPFFCQLVSRLLELVRLLYPPELEEVNKEDLPLKNSFFVVPRNGLRGHGSDQQGQRDQSREGRSRDMSGLAVHRHVTQLTLKHRDA
jgi:hypothetical protein